MKLNNKGFALTSIIYMLIVLFLMMMLLILANLAQRKVVLDKIKGDVKQELNQGGVLAQNIYTVTFDPTIGQINQTSKQVKYNEPYGELPTPTREGYKFVGWRGKNMFNIEIWEQNNSGGVNGSGSSITTENGIITLQNPSNQDIYTLSGINTVGNTVRMEKRKFLIPVERNKQYIVSFNVNGTQRTNTNNSCYYTLNDRDFVVTSISNLGTFNVPAFNSKTITTSNDTDYIALRFGSYIQSETSYSQIQLELGDTATSYEPYQEYTSDTLVTKKENHTLYAMWKPLYTVTFDVNGGTLAQNTKQVSYNEPYGELPTPTREGYTFLGWNGSNLFDKNNNIEDTYVATDGTYTLSSAGSKTIKIPCKPNTTYYIQKEETTRLRYGFYNEEPKENVKATFINEPSSKKEVSFTTENDTTYIAIFIINGPDTTPEKTDSVLNSVMINEGNKYLLYEPYYITPSTTVVQTNDHTLKAIWQANE